MAILRLANGNDVSVKLSVADTIATIEVASATNAFVQLPTEDGPIHVRPSGILAVLEDGNQKTAGFRIAEG
jgi:hypothetical protein